MFWTTAAYAMGGQPQGAEGGAGGLMQLAPIILMFVVFYFLLIRPQQKKAKAHKEMIAALKPGDRIITAGGLFGRIVKIDEEKAVIDLGDSQVTIGRGFISGHTTASAVPAPAPRKKGKKEAPQSAADTPESVEEAAAQLEDTSSTLDVDDREKK